MAKAQPGKLGSKFRRQQNNTFGGVFNPRPPRGGTAALKGAPKVGGGTKSHDPKSGPGPVESSLRKLGGFNPVSQKKVSRKSRGMKPLKPVSQKKQKPAKFSDFLKAQGVFKPVSQKKTPKSRSKSKRRK